MHVKNYSIMPRTIGGLIEDLFQNGLNRVWGEDIWNEQRSTEAPVNIRETEKSYELQLVAPGLKKDGFKIQVEKNVLTISYEHTEENKEEHSRWLRTEYRFRSIRRSFTLNDRIDVSAISARYHDGVLEVSLPKKEQSEPAAQEIKVG